MSLLLALLPADAPRAEAISSLVTYDWIVPYQALAFVAVVAPAAPEDVTCDKWLAYSVVPPPAAARPPSVTATPVLADITAANLDKWFGYSVVPPPAKARPPSVVAAPVLGDVTERDVKWLTASPIQAPARQPQNTGSVAFVSLVVTAAEDVTLDKWLSYDARPTFRAPRVGSDLVFVIRPDDITLDRWLTDSPRQRPLATPQNIGALAWGVLTPPAAPEGPVTLDKWLTDSPRQTPAPPRPPSVIAAPDEEPPPDVIPPVVPPPSGGGGHRGRQFPFRNRYDDPELFRRREPEERIEPHPVQAEGDPVASTRLPVGQTSSLTDLGMRWLRREPPPQIKPLPQPRAAKPPARVKREKTVEAPPAEPPPRPLTPEEEREEELLLLRMLGIL